MGNVLVNNINFQILGNWRGNKQGSKEFGSQVLKTLTPPRRKKPRENWN